LAKKDELSSTERLLELIRDETPAETKPAAGEASESLGGRIRIALSNSVSFAKKPTAVGVDLGHDDLKMVKINRVSERKAEVLGYTRIPFDPSIPREHPDFHQFLHTALTEFCGQFKQIEIWGSISSARVETRHIKIPKVPQRQISNTVFWTYQRLSSFDDKQTIFDFEALGETEEGGVKKTSILAYLAPRAEVEELKRLFVRAGFPLTGISIVPFAVQTLLRSERIKTYGAAVSSLYIGRDWSRIDIFHDDNLVLSRGIKAGIRTMVEALQKEIEQNWLELSLAKAPTSDPNRIRAIKLRLRKEVEAAQEIFFGGIHREAGAAPGESQQAAKEDRFFQMIHPALERLVRQMERTFRHFALNFDNVKVEKIYVSSGVRPHPRVLDFIGDELGLPIEVINPFTADANFLPLVPLPESDSERSSYAPAMGMALANNGITPNFLNTYKDKSKVNSARRINRGVFAAFFALIMLCVGVSIWQERQTQEKDRQRISLQKQLEGFDVRVDRNLILRLVDQIRARAKSIEGSGSNSLGVAVLGEIANLTPANVRLTGLSAKLGAGGPAAPGAKPGALKKDLVVEGLIFGDRLTLETDLAGFMISLQNSPLFKQPTISQKAIETVDNQQAIRFTAQMDLV
jgi:Tfp pilus assembly PilM family ATPase